MVHSREEWEKLTEVGSKSKTTTVGCDFFRFKKKRGQEVEEGGEESGRRTEEIKKRETPDRSKDEQVGQSYLGFGEGATRPKGERER